ncbi:MAG TPA: type IV pili methyl-accepting chemotaxis transducer N-terminal domain-containing protein [Polyangiaceae bacterium]|nr:type IV pili methyl-accepting chemotaxis transducer N-terminal domain-containing protein [Polyangiaceae bacterium]
MFSTISSRLTAILLSFATLLVAVAATSQIVLKRQADDALVVNLAGRQRMLTQKLTKEAAQLVAYSRDANPSQTGSEREQLQNTMRVFEMTLFSLKDGGPAPLNLEITRMRPLPPASPEVSKRLDAVVALWQPFKTNVTKLMQSGGSDGVAARAMFDTNLPLMDQMNSVVTEMQLESESKLALLFYVQAFSLAIGVLLVVVGAWVARATIASPLLKLAAAARSMSTGDLTVDLKVEGTREVVDLGASFDRMRASMIAVMGGGLAGAGANDDL